MSDQKIPAPQGQPSRSLQELLKRSIGGDRSADDELFRYLLVRFRLYAAQRIRDRQAADDVAQEACTTIIEKYKSAVFTVSFEAWAWGVLQTHIKRHFSRTSAERRRMSDEPIDQNQMPAGSDITDLNLELRLNECLRKILKTKPRYARVLNLVFQGYKTDEICGRLKIGPNHLYVVLFRARSMLKACLKKGEI